MFLINHVTNHHLERLHGDIDRGIEQHQGKKAKNHSLRDTHAETAGVGQQAHNDQRQCRSQEQIGYTPSKAIPCLVAGSANNRLDNNTSQGWQKPKITQLVRVGAKRGEYTADVRALKRVSDLYAKESETDIPKFPEALIRNCFHDNKPVD